MATLESLQKEINELRERNKRVDLNKKWETSITRKVLLVLITYFAIGIYMNIIHIEKPWLNAVIPSVGFLLSTLTLSFFKNQWMKFN